MGNCEVCNHPKNKFNDEDELKTEELILGL